MADGPFDGDDSAFDPREGGETGPTGQDGGGEAGFSGPMGGAGFSGPMGGAGFTGPMGGAGLSGPMGAPGFSGPIGGPGLSPSQAGASVYDPDTATDGEPIGPDTKFNRGGAPIAVLGGVFSGGYPLGGPVSQVFRGSGPEPFTLFESTLTSAGPIGDFLIGRGGNELQFGPALPYLALPINGNLG